MSFPEQLKSLRKEKGLTQQELGDAIGLSGRAVSSYESGHRFPVSQEYLERIADFFHVSVDYLLGRSPAKNSPSHDIHLPLIDLDKPGQLDQYLDITAIQASFAVKLNDESLQLMGLDVGDILLFYGTDQVKDGDLVAVKKSSSNDQIMVRHLDVSGNARNLLPASSLFQKHQLHDRDEVMGKCVLALKYDVGRENYLSLVDLKDKQQSKWQEIMELTEKELIPAEHVLDLINLLIRIKGGSSE